MSKKHLNPLEDPPTASSSDDDEVETSEGEDSSSEEEEAPSSAAAVTIAVPGKSADTDSGSETETESDSEPERASIPPPNQGSGKSVAVVTTTTTANPKKKEPTLALPAAKSGTKRPSEGTSRDTNAKRAKKATSGGGDEDKKIGGEDTKKPAFQRLWSEEDEIAVLQGMIDFKGDTGKSPYEDSNGFYEFIKKSISFEVSKNQFMDKIRSLKKKYIMGKDKNGVELTFTKPHDLKCSALSKFIWGPEGLVLDSAVKSNGVSKKSQSKTSKKLDSVKQELVFGSPNGKEEDKNVVVIHGGDLEAQKEESGWFENSFLVRAIAGFGIDEYSVKQRWSLLPEESKKKIEEKLKALQAKEIDFVLMKSEFLHEVISMIAEASKN